MIYKDIALGDVLVQCRWQTNIILYSKKLIYKLSPWPGVQLGVRSGNGDSHQLPMAPPPGQPHSQSSPHPDWGWGQPTNCPWPLLLAGQPLIAPPLDWIHPWSALPHSNQGQGRLANGPWPLPLAVQKFMHQASSFDINWKAPRKMLASSVWETWRATWFNRNSGGKI